MRSLLKPGTGRDSAGISRPVPATKTRDDGVAIDAHARSSAGNTILLDVSMQLIVKLERGVYNRWTGLVDWTGRLDWTGLDWTGLDWTGMDWTQSVRNYITASRKWLFAYLTL